jgi:hypothetical protein
MSRKFRTVTAAVSLRLAGLMRPLRLAGLMRLVRLAGLVRPLRLVRRLCIVSDEGIIISFLIGELRARLTGAGVRAGRGGFASAGDLLHLR